MTVGYTTLPSFVSGISSPQSWINEILDVLSYSSTPSQVEYITATPGVIIPGKLYLVGAGSGFATPGTIAVYLTPFSASIQGIVPPIGTVVQGWTKIAGDWVRSEFYNGAHVVLTPSVATTYTLPNDFDGVCTVINNSATTIQIQEAAGRAPFGTLINTPLPAGVYQVFQNSATAGI